MKLLALILVLAFATPAFAGFQIDQVTTNEGDSSAPSVASSPDGLTMVAFGLDGYPLLMHFAATQLVPTQPSPGETWPEPVVVSSGYVPRVCWSREGFVVAVNSGQMVLVYETDLEGNFEPGSETMIDPGGPVMGIDLWGVPSLVAGHYAFMTVMVSTNPPSSDFKVLFSSASAISGWSDFEIVAEESTQPPLPQMTWGIGPAGPWPRIFFLTSALGGVELVYTTKDPATGWSTPTVVPGSGGTGMAPIEGSFDVVTSYSLPQNVLGLGPQPTCPCGSINFLAQGVGGTWDPAVDLTVDHLDYNWPKTPRLAANLTDPSGQVHAFWMQVGSGSDLEPKTKTLEYWVKAPGGWVDAGGFLDGQDGGPLGEYLGLDVSPSNQVVMAWTRRDTIEGVPQPQQVWMARAHEPSGVPEPGITRAAASLTAWPNPFNPRVTLSMRAAASGPAALDVYDLRGRHVARLFEGELGENTKEVDWDGRSSAGGRVPSGVYFARLATGRDKVVTKLLLAE